MFVKLQTSLAGPGGSHTPGSVVEMEDAEAGRYIAANLATEATEADIAAHEARVAAEKAGLPAPPSASPTDTAGDTTPDSTPSVDLSKMTKAEIAAHAAEVHGLELDPAMKKADMIAAIAEKTSS